MCLIGKFSIAAMLNKEKNNVDKFKLKLQKV
jgi:hypothetical protein